MERRAESPPPPPPPADQCYEDDEYEYSGAGAGADDEAPDSVTALRQLAENMAASREIGAPLWGN